MILILNLSDSTSIRIFRIVLKIINFTFLFYNNELVVHGATVTQLFRLFTAYRTPPSTRVSKACDRHQNQIYKVRDEWIATEEEKLEETIETVLKITLLVIKHKAITYLVLP
jgi:hypothetical protein